MARAKGEVRQTIRLKSTESDHCYYTSKNKRNTAQRLERRKYDPILRRHVLYREER
jgi:large subunit ribosomal protein L33